MKQYVFPVLALLVSCETNNLADAGPCGSRSCGTAMFRDHAVLWEMAYDDCLALARNPRDAAVCREAFEIVSGVVGPAMACACEPVAGVPDGGMRP